MKGKFSIVLTLSILGILFGTAKAQNNVETKTYQLDGETYYTTTQVDEKIKVKSKPRSSTDGKCAEDTGRVSLRVYFQSSGKITKAEIVAPSSCEYFNESSLKAAKRIKFKPAMKDGQAVSYTTIVEYDWRKY